MEASTIIAVDILDGKDAVGNACMFHVNFVVYSFVTFSALGITVKLWYVPVLHIDQCLLAVLDMQEMESVVNVCILD